MNWDYLPLDIITYILHLRKIIMLENPAAIKIQSVWKCYKTRILIGRFNMLRYLRDFRIWNPTINEFIERSKL